MAALGMSLGLASAAWASPPAGRGLPLPHLDLRLPVNAEMLPEKSTAAFPSSLHRSALGYSQVSDLPALGTQGQTPTRVEEFARRVHREGLPVARLWENKSALVSLGLNQKGKPGLWIIQKIH